VCKAESQVHLYQIRTHAETKPKLAFEPARALGFRFGTGMLRLVSAPPLLGACSCSNRHTPLDATISQNGLGAETRVCCLLHAHLHIGVRSYVAHFLASSSITPAVPDIAERYWEYHRLGLRVPLRWRNETAVLGDGMATKQDSEADAFPGHGQENLCETA